MQRSIHYYVLSLSEQTNRLYEGFRDKLIDIQNTNFPFENSINAGNSASKDTQLREFFDQTNQRFAHYYEQDPLRMVVVGEKRNLAIFEALTTHQDILIGMVEGDYTATSPDDLGMIVWPVVKEAIASANKNAIGDLETAISYGSGPLPEKSANESAMRDIEATAGKHKVVSGIDAVGRSAESETGSTLFVEEDYHVKGSIDKTDHSQVLSKHVNLWEVLDDVVDIIIEKVLQMGGNVVFVNSGSLIKLQRIALILRG